VKELFRLRADITFSLRATYALEKQTPQKLVCKLSLFRVQPRLQAGSTRLRKKTNNGTHIAVVEAKNVALLDDKPTKMRLALSLRLWEGDAESAATGQKVLVLNRKR
jgi:hypothetical protein